MRNSTARKFALLMRIMTDSAVEYEAWLPTHPDGNPEEFVFGRMCVHPYAREVGLRRGMTVAQAEAVIDRVFGRHERERDADNRRRQLFAAAPSPN